MIGLLIALMFTIPSMSFANICFWKACPQDTGAYKLKYGAVEPTPVPDIAFLANINLSGETDYIFRNAKDGGSGFGIGVGTTLITIEGFLDIDGKFVNIVTGPNAQLAGLGAALSVPVFDG